ncbi:MAG: hypothetical protein WC383_18335 [Gammaproteobacteria bacterium]
MRMRNGNKKRMKGFFDLAIGGALLLLFGAAAALIVKAERSDDDQRGQAEQTQEVAMTDTDTLPALKKAPTSP